MKWNLPVGLVTYFVFRPWSGDRQDVAPGETETAEQPDAEHAGLRPGSSPYLWDREIDGPYWVAGNVNATPEAAAPASRILFLSVGVWCFRICIFFLELLEELIENIEEFRRALRGGGPQRPTPA